MQAAAKSQSATFADMGRYCGLGSRYYTVQLEVLPLCSQQNRNKIFKLPTHLPSPSLTESPLYDILDCVL
jgi:hypothetical protein